VVSLVLVIKLAGFQPSRAAEERSLQDPNDEICGGGLVIYRFPESVMTTV